MMASTDDTLTLVQSIYDVALGQKDWPSILRDISEASGGHSGLLRLVDCRQEAVGFAASYGYDPSHLEAYRKHYIHLDPYRDHLAAAPTGALLLSDQVVPLATRKKTAYFNDYEQLGDRYHALGSALGRERDFLLYLGLSRGQRAGPYDNDSLNFIRRVLPHLLRAIQLQRLICNAVDAQRLSEAALDELRFGVILIDSAGCVLFANSAALALANTFNLSVGQNGLTLPSPHSNDRLQGLIKSTIVTNIVGKRSPGGDMNYSRPGIGILQFRIFPVLSDIVAAVVGPRIQAAVFLVRPGPQHLDPQQIAAQFGLTQAEARIAVLLTEGRTIADAATCVGISMATARTHLRNIFAKTATSRQSELALHLLTSLAGISAEKSINTEN